MVPTELEAWKQVLAEGYPIIFGLSLFGSFDKQRKPGYVPEPSEGETGRESHGGHAMLAVGYSDPDEMFIVRNSWGPDWGDKGYCYIPYDYNDEPGSQLRRLVVHPPGRGRAARRGGRGRTTTRASSRSSTRCSPR